MRRLIVAITGASGAVYGVRLLSFLRELSVETHLIISNAGALNIRHELSMTREEVEKTADFSYRVDDIGAAVSSGSFRTMGMIVAPCSMRSLSAIAHGLADNLITRAADVTLKERRRLVLMVRETPFNLVHLRNMTAATEAGAVIFPPLPAFYQRPQNIGQMVDVSLARVLALFDLHVDNAPEWRGLHDVVDK